MPLVAVPLDLPPDVVEVRAGDVDADGRAELVWVSRVPAASGPDGVRLTVHHIDEEGRLAGTDTLDLGREPLLWDVEGGLWGVAGTGPVAVEAGGLRPLADVTTVLSALGPTTPAAADVVTDLDGDGVPEVLFHTRGQLRAISVDGTDRGGVRATASGELGGRDRSGGRTQLVGVSWPAVVLEDFDGDGIRDVLLPDGATLRVHLTGDQLGARTRSVRLPLDLDPDRDPAARGAQRKELARSWFRDVDADGRVDLVTMHWVVDGSWFGSRAEITLYRNTGDGFGAGTAVTTPSSPVETRLLDLDGDGDLDLLVPQVDTGLGNLARAMLARRVQVDALVHDLDGGRFAAEARSLRTLSVPVDDPDALAVKLDGDIDGDGFLDAVLLDGEAPLAVHRGGAAGIAEDPWATLAVPRPPGEAPLFVHDLTGDGRAEVVVWGPRSRRATLVVARPE